LNDGLAPRCLALEHAVADIEIELRPFRALERPLVLGALHEFVDVSHLQEHARLPAETVVLAVQEMIEEAQLKLAPIIRVEMRPVLDPVHLEPLLLTGRAHETLEIAAGMQALAAPIGRRQERRPDSRPNRRARTVVCIVERMGANVLT
jgi:hypothetical protein